MNERTPSPAQIRARAARAFRAHQLTPRPPDAQQLQNIVVERLARLAPAALRQPMQGETALSPAEVLHGTYHGLIGD